MKQGQSILITYGYGILLTALFLCLCPVRSTLHFSEWRIVSLWQALFILGLFLLGLSLYSAFVCRWITSASDSHARMTGVLLRVLLNLGAAFPLLLIWYRSTLARLLIFDMPLWELWLVSFALAWMTAPFVVLWLIPVGARLGALFSQQD